MLNKIAIIGAGNVAWSLSAAIDNIDNTEVVAIASPTTSRATEIAARLRAAEAVTIGEMAKVEADIFILAVPDTAVADVADALAGTHRGAIWAHTSGSVDMYVLKPLSDNIGVFYPMQTFTRGRMVDMATVPFFIEGSDDRVVATLKTLAGKLSPMVTVARGDDRALLHAAAVFACNFTNHLWAISSQLLQRRGIPFEVMRPLVMETVKKAFEDTPDSGQTGPARRGDLATIGRHTAIVGKPYDKMYQFISQSIIDRFNEQN